jgi:hypothetical protein
MHAYVLCSTTIGMYMWQAIYISDGPRIGMVPCRQSSRDKLSEMNPPIRSKLKFV